MKKDSMRFIKEVIELKNKDYILFIKLLRILKINNKE